VHTNNLDAQLLYRSAASWNQVNCCRAVQKLHVNGLQEVNKNEGHHKVIKNGGAMSGGDQVEFHQELWHQKTRVDKLL